MDYELIYYGLYVRPKWIVFLSIMEYSLVQNGMQMNFIQFIQCLFVDI